MTSSFNLLENAELDRILRINLPARRLLFIGGFALTVVGVIAGTQWRGYAETEHYTSYQQIKDFGEATYWKLTVVMFGLMFVLAPAMTALSFIQEKLRGTAIFQQMILMSPFDIALGKFLGSGAASYFAAMIILPFALFAALLGGETFGDVFRLYAFLLIGGLSFQAVGLFLSAALSAPAEKALRGGLLIGPAVGVLGAVNALYWSSYFQSRYYRSPGYYRWHFYGIDLPAHAVILGVLVFVGVWAFAGAVRGIKASQLVPVGPSPVWLFFATAEALLVGLLWGWQPVSDIYARPPISNLVFYILVNWAALLVLAGSISLSRNRLGEWWSAGNDPLGLFQRQEIRNNFKTFLIALGVSEGGLIALWTSYHMNMPGLLDDLNVSQLAPIAIGFAFTILGMLAFVQYCAMQRFRARGWAGVAIVVVFYVVMGVAGALFEDDNNTPSLLNPAAYSHAITKGDPYMDRVPSYASKYNVPEDYSTSKPRPANVGAIVAHGLIAEGLLALGCFGLAFLKWRKIQDEMLRGKAT